MFRKGMVWLEMREVLNSRKARMKGTKHNIETRMSGMV
jgi:hypothetical protein